MVEHFKQLFFVAFSLGAARLELAAVELEEERLRLAELALAACVALFFSGLAVMLLLLFVIVLMWDVQRLLTIGVLALLFASLGTWRVWCWRDMARRKPAFMAATKVELRLDAKALSSHRPLHE